MDILSHILKISQQYHLSKGEKCKFVYVFFFKSHDVPVTGITTNMWKADQLRIKNQNEIFPVTLLLSKAWFTKIKKIIIIELNHMQWPSFIISSLGWKY